MKPTRTLPALADVLASIGDPLRLRVLRLVEVQELAVGEVAKVVQLPQSTVSRHLKVLADAGWLTRRPDGTATYFSLVPDNLDPAPRNLWAAVREPLADDLDSMEDLRRLRAVLAERRTDSQSFFGRVSGEWDELRQSLFGGRFTPVALLGLIRRDWVIADLGCGTGNASEFLAPFVERVYAVDSSGPMLHAARRRLAGVPNVEFVEAGVEKTGLPPRSIDAGVCVLVLHHLEDPLAALRESARVLRPDRGGGVLLIVDMMEHTREEYRRTMGHKHLGFGRERMLDMITRAGLKDAGYFELPGEPEARGPGLFAATGRIA
jgi:SAM-dependent methyltransferase